MCPCIPDWIGIWTGWFLRRGENRSARRKTSQSKVVRTNNKLNSHMMLTPGFKLGPHWWEASTLTTTPPLPPEPVTFCSVQYAMVVLIDTWCFCFDSCNGNLFYYKTLLFFSFSYSTLSFRWISQHLPEEEQKKLNSLLEHPTSLIKISYNDYNWNLNGSKL